MTTLATLVEQHGRHDAPDVPWFHRLVGDWQLIADLAFADVVLWLPTQGSDGFVALSHARPSSSGTLFYRDFIGQPIRNAWRGQVDDAFSSHRIVEATHPEPGTDGDTRVRAVPVSRRVGDVLTTVAVITTHSNVAERTPSRQELTFKQCADDLLRMMTVGDYPDESAPTGPRRGAPRASDGLIRLDSAGLVTFASPNALSAFVRLGFREELEGRSLAEVTTELIDDSGDVDETLPLVVTGRAPWRTDIETHSVTISLRALPLRRGGERIGAIVLARDVTELRHQEQSLITKDATIREIHHRVKNNLQTVAALLRIQARRTHSDEAQQALVNAERRVASIAVVHDTLSEGLSQSVDFDAVFDRTLKLTSEVASIHNARVRTERRGSFGVLPSAYATPLALALTELVTNAVEHGLEGRHDGLVRINADRDDDTLTVRVCDNGSGLPAGRVGSGLGTQIVKTLITGELSGAIDWGQRVDQGTEVTISVPLRFLDRG
ncbi:MULTISPECIES: sensor histidine kinase [unclassified Agrococcus]|uniref:sensor histidine kinase n=1 Tax=unclassified Agrococcus TaxID=2615065 RepID=UPI00360A0286